MHLVNSRDWVMFREKYITSRISFGAKKHNSPTKICQIKGFSLEGFLEAHIWIKWPRWGRENLPPNFQSASIANSPMVLPGFCLKLKLTYIAPDKP